ncbi:MULTISPECIES: hypothetical protein [Halomicrobium]|uniref:Uncharacterized protein n=2 Tax=Halomicrobium mukohataei TaxID=57705 RepID=C7NW87_HALMD|nr:MULTISPECIES: hypothetical protein [Halomicrobium]ACV46228.1 hypothetical protein Hmuk_0089 [Halomicrobium mukohataei DSM 12286]QCD64790.1 hypothetical protein E5139_03740 [Halomicrobium mukohataei]QFR19597.1 hypothetical protein GBQ70_03740 [Halomicrobium sp. ZPS1]
MNIDRRLLLKGVGATLLGSTALSSASAEGESEMDVLLSQTNGVHAAADFTEDSRILGLSDAVSVESAPDPTRPGQGQSPDREVLHITSLPAESGRGGEGQGRGSGGQGNGGNEDDDGDDHVTFDYGFSMLGLTNRELTVRDLATYGGGAGFSYEWLVTEENVSAVGTDQETVGVGPDEAWLILRQPTATDRETALVDDALAGRLTAIIREFEQDRATDQWHTRDVGAELDDDAEPAWQELSVASRQFEDLGTTPLSAYGDAEVLTVGVGRGDPYDGPSVLDAYYRNLQVAGEAYSFPKAQVQRGRGRGNDG